MIPKKCPHKISAPEIIIQFQGRGAASALLLLFTTPVYLDLPPALLYYVVKQESPPRILGTLKLNRLVLSLVISKLKAVFCKLIRNSHLNRWFLSRFCSDTLFLLLVFCRIAFCGSNLKKYILSLDFDVWQFRYIFKSIRLNDKVRSF